MIKMDLAENGADSLKAAYLIMEKLPTLEDGLAHNLKDAVISLNHGIEILFKLKLFMTYVMISLLLTLSISLHYWKKLGMKLLSMTIPMRSQRCIEV